jgi:hypothetical protein
MRTVLPSTSLTLIIASVNADTSLDIDYAFIDIADINEVIDSKHLVMIRVDTLSLHPTLLVVNMSFRNCMVAFLLWSLVALERQYSLVVVIYGLCHDSLTRFFINKAQLLLKIRMVLILHMNAWVSCNTLDITSALRSTVSRRMLRYHATSNTHR